MSRRAHAQIHSYFEGAKFGITPICSSVMATTGPTVRGWVHGCSYHIDEESFLPSANLGRCLQTLDAGYLAVKSGVQNLGSRVSHPAQMWKGGADFLSLGKLKQRASDLVPPAPLLCPHLA